MADKIDGGQTIDVLSADDELLQLEREKFQAGFRFVVGIDEVGRGPLAGPVVAAAVGFPPGAKIPRVNDSKQLTGERREALDAAIRAVPGVRIGIAEVSVEVIDRINILQATHQAMRKAAEAIPEADCLLVDGLPVKGLPAESFNVIKGDARSASIAAASIIAKVYRDRLMSELDKQYPGYGLSDNKGYGTAQHLQALKTLGASSIHRKSFAPVRDVITPPPEQLELF
ncbi:MAG: ribonuclease HII [Lentisphaerae bacterium]|nr:ribonuclease HII [Lentisphaerota bacterium]